VPETTEGDLQAAQQPEGIGHVIVAEVGDPEDLPLELPLAAGHRRPEFALESLDDRARFESRRREECRQRVAVGARGHQGKTQSPRGGAGHRG
jgi:hypothetical protein